MFLALAQLTNKAFTDAGKGRIRQSLTALVMKIQPLITSSWQERWDEEVDDKLHASCPKLMTSITRDAQIKKMKLLLIAFE